LKTADLYAGIPVKYFVNGKAKARFGKMWKEFNEKDKLAERTFPDKFRPGTEYTLYYFLWAKQTQMPEQADII
jgi:hypothetical protein